MKRIFTLLIGLVMMSGCLEGPEDPSIEQGNVGIKPYLYPFEYMDVCALRWPGEFKTEAHIHCHSLGAPAELLDDDLYKKVYEVSNETELTQAMADFDTKRVVLKNNITLGDSLLVRGNTLIQGPGKLDFALSYYMIFSKSGNGKGCFYTNDFGQLTNYKIDQSVRITAPTKNFRTGPVDGSVHLVFEGISEGRMQIKNVQSVVFVGRSFDIAVDPTVQSVVAFNASVRDELSGGPVLNELLSYNSKFADIFGSMAFLSGCFDPQSLNLTTNAGITLTCKSWGQIYRDWISCGGTK